MTLKQKVHLTCLELVDEKIRLVQKNLAGLKESGANETKSTAGDKHETALAMLQIEQANARAQLNDLLAKKADLHSINPKLSPVSIVKGSLVKTNKGHLFVSTAIGKLMVDGLAVIALSAQSPLGSRLLGLQAGEKQFLIPFNTR